MGITFDEFVKAYMGKSTDYDGVSGVQCVDLIKIYMNKVFTMKPGAWGNAKDYYENFNNVSALKNNFTRIANTPDFVPKKGDICVWGKNVSSSHNYGHIAIATGEGNTKEFYTYDQNWNGKPMKKVKHNYSAFLGVLRPNNQTAISGKTNTSVSADSSSFPNAVLWKNGSTIERVYKQDNLKEQVGTVFAKSTAKCYAKSNSAWLIVYDLDGTSKHKAGFVKYAGGLKSAPTKYKIWKNGSTQENVYADTAKKTRIGSIFAYGSARCYGIIDNMYLVRYQIDGTSIYKTGFVAYKGEC